MKLAYFVLIAVFLAALGALTSAIEAEQLELNLTVGASQESALAIETVELSPDEDSLKAGIQLNPAENTNKNLSVSVIVSGAGAADSEVAASLAAAPASDTINLEKIQDIDSATALYEGKIALQLTLLAGNHTLNITAAAGNAQATASADFEWLPLVAFELDSSSIKLAAQPGNRTEIEGDSDFSTKDKPTVKNTGNTVINIAFASQGFFGYADSALDAKISSANIKASLEKIIGFNSTLSKTLSNSSRTIEAELQPGESRALSFSIYAPKTSKLGSYRGNITMVALTA